MIPYDGTATLTEGALSGATNITASGTVQAEQLIQLMMQLLRMIFQLVVMQL